ncbi:MAG: hypothetical protein BWY82_02089 [Verrucomicrobia bacterium ADurb.Bin474]|nr:MAG: hypothetical protein BWY82_02089 [Verrucomicrobia bacterium ADurb.Bin474]
MTEAALLLKSPNPQWRGVPTRADSYIQNPILFIPSESPLPEGVASAILYCHTHQPSYRMADERGLSSLPSTALPIAAGASLLAPTSNNPKKTKWRALAPLL